MKYYLLQLQYFRPYHLKLLAPVSQCIKTAISAEVLFKATVTAQQREWQNYPPVQLFRNSHSAGHV